MTSAEKKSLRITVNLTQEEHAVLSQYAAKNDSSLAWVVRRAVKEFLNRRVRESQRELPLDNGENS